MQDLKRHLAKNHFKTDLSSDNDIVKLPGGTFTCFLCSDVEPTTNLATVVAHIATIHNTVEDLYIRKLKGESLGVSGENYVCELCEWFTRREGQFLNHITMQHCMKMLTNRNIIREHGSGRELYRCAVCNNVFNTLQDYLDHVGKDLHCNQSLGFYSWQVDVHKQGIHNPPLLSTGEAWERLKLKLSLQVVKKVRPKHLKSILPSLTTNQLPSNAEDPCSSDINTENLGSRRRSKPVEALQIGSEKSPCVPMATGPGWGTVFT